jgi:hypothetical protein
VAADEGLVRLLGEPTMNNVKVARLEAMAAGR